MITEKKKVSTDQVNNELDIEYIKVTDDGSIQKSIEGQSLDELNLHRYCCRRMFLGHVHLISSI